MIHKKHTLHLFAKDITGDLVKERQEVTIQWRKGEMVLDEPSFNGGHDAATPAGTGNYPPSDIESDLATRNYSLQP